MTAKTEKKSQRGAEQLFPSLLFFVFVLCAVFTILIGSRVYENIRERDNASFRTDTALAYMTNKVRQGDIADSVEIRMEGDTQILVLTSVLEDMEFETWIYQMDGGLYELFTMTDSGLDTSAGQRIMDCGPVSFSMDGTDNGETMLTISLDDDARYAEILLRSSEKGGHVS